MKNSNDSEDAVIVQGRSYMSFRSLSFILELNEFFRLIAFLMFSGTFSYSLID